MKKVLITGKGSYIGTAFKYYLEQFPDEYYIEELDVQDDSWRTFDFNKFDTVFHVAGIAHIKEKKENENAYYKVNRDLTFEIAKKAKQESVKQFIFMSSMSVYGLQYSNTAITATTLLNPNTYYGKSKMEAEDLLNTLEDATFKICILRPPMVYGDNSPGNLTKLMKMVKKIHVFPTIENQRSSITVEKLVTFVKTYIDNESHGIYFPQNDEYLCTYQIVKEKMENENVKVIYTGVFNWLIRILIGKIGLITKAFGNLVYEKTNGKDLK